MASTAIAAKPIKAPPLSIPQVRGHVLNALKETGKDLEKTLNDIVGTWRHDVAFSKPIIRFSGGDAYVEIQTSDDIFGYLDEGTTIRHAVMTRDFIPKTIPNGPYKSGAGRGGVAFRSNRIRLPGIQARNWTLRMSQEMSIVLAFRLDSAVAKGLASAAALP